MGVKPQFDMSAIRKYAQSKRDEFIQAALEAYKLTCIEIVNRAKSVDTYKDQTHALRSSIGCVVYHNGVEVFNYFEANGGENGTGGVNTGLEFARSIADVDTDKEIVAVIVAGMEYAIYVEAKGFDVLTGSTLRFEDNLKAEFQNLKDGFVEHLKDQIG